MVELRAKFRATPSSVREAREAVLDYARLCGFPLQSTVDIALGVGEALANAVEHGNRDLGFISVTCSFALGELTVEVRDQGIGFDVSGISKRRREPDAIRGFGLSIMRSVMDSVEYEQRGTCVRLRKRLPAASAGENEASKEA